ncbi:MAG TPA: methylaspartate mutase, partial [Nitrospira sp.]|nr:methylaspartate mutase [Nitrospira sp.]
DGRIEKGTLTFGDLKLFSLTRDQQATVTLQPSKQVDLGEGPGQSFTRTVKGGVVGLMLDGRGRPLQLPTEQAARVALLTRWYQAVGLYPTGSS